MDFWLLFGFMAQACFFGRFAIQWLASEKAGKSVIPNAFWYMSVVGASGILIYSIHIGDIVFVCGSGFGLVFYFRNIWLIKKKKQEKLK